MGLMNKSELNIATTNTSLIVIEKGTIEYASVVSDSINRAEVMVTYHIELTT